MPKVSIQGSDPCTVPVSCLLKQNAEMPLNISTTWLWLYLHGFLSYIYLYKKMLCISCMSIELCKLSSITAYTTGTQEIAPAVIEYYIPMIRPCDATGKGEGAAWKLESWCSNSCQHSDTDGMTRNTSMSPSLNKCAESLFLCAAQNKTPSPWKLSVLAVFLLCTEYVALQ